MRAAGLAVLLPLLAACTSGEAPVLAPTSVPGNSRLVATSADGRYRLRIEGMEWFDRTGSPGGPKLGVWTSLQAPDPDSLIAWENPLLRIVTPDGGEHPLILEGAQGANSWRVTSAQRSLFHLFDIGAERSRLATLAFQVPVLHASPWETSPVAEVARGGTAELEAPPFHLVVTAGPDICRVKATGGTKGFLSPAWACTAADVVDSGGESLDGGLSGDWDGGAAAVFTRRRTDDAASSAIAYPVTVRLRVPRKRDSERVEFEFHDLDLPPRQGAVFRDIQPIPGRPTSELRRASDLAWSPWSEPVNGLSCRVSLPVRVRRGDAVTARLVLKFDPGSVPPGARFLDAREFDYHVRLVLRRQGMDEPVVVRLHDGGICLQDPPAEAERTAPDWLPLDDGLPREWPLPFRLAKAWDDLIPGNWEARVEMESDPDLKDPTVWSGTVTTPPLPFLVEEPSIRRFRVRVPTSVRLKADPASPGSLLACIDAEDPGSSGTVVIEARSGFLLGFSWKHAGGSLESFGGEDGEAVSGGAWSSSLEPRPDGTIDEASEVLIFESSGDPDDLSRSSQGRGSYRVLWTRSLRVTATAAEIEALRR